MRAGTPALRPRRSVTPVRVSLPRRQRHHRGLRVPLAAPGREPALAATAPADRGPVRDRLPRAGEAADLPAPLRGQAGLRVRVARRPTPTPRAPTPLRAATG